MSVFSLQSEKYLHHKTDKLVFLLSASVSYTSSFIFDRRLCFVAQDKNKDPEKKKTKGRKKQESTDGTYLQLSSRRQFKEEMETVEEHPLAAWSQV